MNPMSLAYISGNHHLCKHDECVCTCHSSNYQQSYETCHSYSGVSYEQAPPVP